MAHLSAYALLSVSDKTSLLDFAAALLGQGLRLLATDSTATYLRGQGLPVLSVEEFTGFPSIMDGRVKTLHPKIHAGILWDRNKQEHSQTAEALGFCPIDVVVVNLYPFVKEAVEKKLPLADAKEFIDIGGPTLLRAAAKNWQQCLAVCDPADYSLIMSEWQAGPILSQARRQYLAAKTFRVISNYDAEIARYWEGQLVQDEKKDLFADLFPSTINLSLHKVQGLRYGENPQQKAALYKLAAGGPGELAEAPRLTNLLALQGKALSYNNFLDLGAACELVLAFTSSAQTALCLVKHMNPCGCAIALDGQTLDEQPLPQVFARALATDPKSAFGGVVACNVEIDQQTALQMADIFLECIAAPSFSKAALEVFAEKKNLRLVQADWLKKKQNNSWQLRKVLDAILIQGCDQISKPESWRTVTSKGVTLAQQQDLVFAEKVCAQVKSNAIVFAKDGQTLGIGAGQMSRIDALRFAAEKAKEAGLSLQGGVCASDAFFPFSDCVELAGALGIAAVVQPGGSIRDQDSIDVANSLGMAMVMTGLRHFRH